MSKRLKALLKGKIPVDKEKRDLSTEIYRLVKNSKKTHNSDRLLQASKKLSKYLASVKRGRSFDFDKYNTLILDLLSEHYAEGSRDSRKIHPSSLRYECERKMFYLLKGVAYSDRVHNDIDGRLQMIFDQGHWFHSYIQAILKEAGILIQSEVPIVDKEKHISGRMDGLIHWNGEDMALEVKTMNSFRFRIGKLAPFEDNEYQAGTYASRMEGVKKICYLYFNKDTSEIAIHIKPIKKKLVRLSNEKINDINRALLADTVPERTHCSKKSDESALSCPFRSVCFKK